MFSKSTPSPGNSQVQNQSLQDTRRGNSDIQQAVFTMSLSLVAGTLLLVSSLITSVKSLLDSGTINVLVETILMLGAISLGGAWLLAKKGQVKLAGGIALAAILAAASQGILTGTLTFLALVSCLVTAMIGLIILGIKVAYAIVAWGSGLAILTLATDRLTTVSSITPNQAKVGFSDLFYLISLMFITIWLAGYLSKRFNKANERLNQQASQLLEALAEIERKREVGEDVSRQVFSMTAELNAIASQQSSGSQQQATALTQLTTFLQEMTATAENIASKTDLLSQAAHEIKEVTLRVKNATEDVSRVGETGAVSVDETINANQRVNELYAELQEILSGLGQRQAQIKEVVSVIRSISDETHLLSLNAAIEAAGAGEQGERFAVVAGEVKALADRAVRASRQVNDILSQVEQRIQAAFVAAEKGHKEIGSALVAAQQSGEVLRELVVAIYQTNEEVEQIDQATTLVSQQSKEISFATKQQYSASNQALVSLQSIGSVASQNANGSAEVTISTRNLEELSHSLLTTLVTSNSKQGSLPRSSQIQGVPEHDLFTRVKNVIKLG